MDLSDNGQAAHLCDDTAFAHKLPDIMKIIDSPFLNAGVLIHPGMDERKEIPISANDQSNNKCPTHEQWIAMRSKAK